MTYALQGRLQERWNKALAARSLRLTTLGTNFDTKYCPSDFDTVQLEQLEQLYDNAQESHFFLQKDFKAGRFKGAHVVALSLPGDAGS
jgi:hypothetical protein